MLGEERMVIEIRVDKLLEARGRTFYWLAKETGISHSTLWRLKTGRARKRGTRGEACEVEMNRNEKLMLTPRCPQTSKGFQSGCDSTPL